MKGRSHCNPPRITPPNNTQLKGRQRPSIKHRPGLMRGTCYDLLPPTLPSAPLISPRELFCHSLTPFFSLLIWRRMLFHLGIPFHLRFTWGRGNGSLIWVNHPPPQKSHCNTAVLPSLELGSVCRHQGPTLWIILVNIETLLLLFVNCFQILLNQSKGVDAHLAIQCIWGFRLILATSLTFWTLDCCLLLINHLSHTLR